MISLDANIQLDQSEVLARLARIEKGISRLEMNMATINETLDTLRAAVDANAAAVQEAIDDLTSLLAGNLTAEQQASADEILARITASTQALVAADVPDAG